MKVPNYRRSLGVSKLSLSRLQNEGSQPGLLEDDDYTKSIKATE